MLFGMPTTAPPHAANPADEWWTGSQVRAHVVHCSPPDAALIGLGYEIAAGRARAKPMSAAHPGAGGRPKVVEAPDITPDLWWRIHDLAPGMDIWSAPVLHLPLTGNEKAIDLIGLRFNAADVRAVAEAYGYSPPAASKPKSAGGIGCRAHGAAVTKLVLELLETPERILKLTAVSQTDRLKKFYEDCDDRGLTEQNLERVASGMLEQLRIHVRKPSATPPSGAVEAKSASSERSEQN